MPIGDADRFDLSSEANLIRGAVAHAALHSTAGHPQAKTARAVITTGLSNVFLIADLSDWKTTKFAAPDDQRLVE